MTTRSDSVKVLQILWLMLDASPPTPFRCGCLATRERQLSSASVTAGLLSPGFDELYGRGLPLDSFIAYTSLAPWSSG